MEESGTPLPRVAGQIAVPEAMKDGLRGAWTKRARGVKVQVSHLSPFVDGNGFVPDALDEGCFLLSPHRSPGVLPIHRGISRKGSTPLGPAKIHWVIVLANPATG